MKFEITKYLCPHNEKDCPAYKEFVNNNDIQITTTESGERVYHIVADYIHYLKYVQNAERNLR